MQISAGLDASVEHISVPAPSLASGIEMDCMACLRTPL